MSFESKIEHDGVRYMYIYSYMYVYDGVGPTDIFACQMLLHIHSYICMYIYVIC